jgi:hypothetical protein
MSPRALTPRTLGLLAVLVGTGALAVGIRQVRGGPWDASPTHFETSPAAPRPLDARTYAQRLQAEAGGPIEPRALAERARAVSAELEALLDNRARRLDPAAGDWRPAYTRLQNDTAATGAEILKAYERETERARAFCVERQLVTVPATSPRIYEIQNDALRRLFPLAMNRGDGTLGITLAPPARVAGFEHRSPESPDPAAAYRRNHCRVCIPPIAVHETYPGHHVAFAFQRGAEAGRENGRWPYFHEGWAQYAELLMWEEGYWQGDPALEMGALHLMLLRATRAEVDAGLHGGGLSPAEARRIYVERLAIDEDAAASEVAGHLQAPGKKASYLVGALQLLALRDALGHPRGAERRAWHDQLLRRGGGTLPAVAREELGVKIPVLPARGLLTRPD